LSDRARSPSIRAQNAAPHDAYPVSSRADTSAGSDAFRAAWQIAAQVRSGVLRAERVVEDAVARIRALNPTLNAFTDLTRDRALEEARELDRRREQGELLPPLAGVPFAVKNLLSIKGLTTRAGSRIERESAPASQDAELICRWTRSGAVLLGALHMGEYAYDFTGENAHDGACRNPHDPEHMSGGSSSGSAAAVASGLTPLSLGSDTNGSIRVPASFCGVFGLKPTYGRLTRHGSFPFCDSLDHLGPLARCPRDLSLAYDALQGADPRDPACSSRAPDPTGPLLDAGIDGRRVAVATGYFGTRGLPAVESAITVAARALGAEREIEVPGAEAGRAAAFLITNAESGALHLSRLRMRAHDFDPDTRDRFLAGALLPASWYVHAQRVRRAYATAVLAIFERGIDLIVAPATPCCAPRLGQRHLELRGERVLLRPNLGLFTQPISCIGLPVVAAPIESGSRLPIGVQLIAPPWREDLCLRAAELLWRSGAARARVPPGIDPQDSPSGPNAALD